MISAILSLLGSSAVGTLIGGIFAFLNRKADFDVKKLELEHETKKWSHELDVKDKDIAFAQQEALGRLNVALVQTDGAIETARFQAIAAAQVADRTEASELIAAGSLSWLLVAAAFINKIIRPLATFALAGTAIYINLILIGKLQDSWATYTTIQQYDSAMQAFAWITGQAGAVLGYWFVSRGAAMKTK